MKTNSNYKVLVDFHTKVTPNEKHKIIFSRDRQTTLWFKIKKFFMQKEMQIASAKYIKNIFEEYSAKDKTYINPFRNINEVDGLDEDLVIDAFADLEKEKNLIFQLKTSPLNLIMKNR